MRRARTDTHGHGLRRACRATGGFINGNAPEVHRSAAVARKVQVPSVRRPDDAPVERGVVGDFDRLTACGRDLFGNPLPSNFPPGRHWALACGIPLLLLGVLGRRVRAVEVVS